MPDTHKVTIYYQLEKDKAVPIGPLAFEENEFSLLTNHFETYVSNRADDEADRDLTNGFTYWYLTDEGRQPVSLRLNRILMMGPALS